MAPADPRVFTIPPGIPFLPALADALLDGSLIGEERSSDASGLADATIYLPTRRAARAFAALLGERGGGRAQLLPRIVPLGEADAAELDLAAGAGALEGAENLAPPIAPLERRLILTRLIQGWSAQVRRERRRVDPGMPFLVPASPADAVALAGDLESLMDSLATEGVPWDRIPSAVEADYSAYFEITRKFVQIAAENWPSILEARGASDPARRRSALIEAEARRLTRERPERPIVAAGSTGSIPATAGLLAAIAGLPRGAVVLPGLDLDLDDESWKAIGADEAEGIEPVHGHPQLVLGRLLARQLKCGRSAVRVVAAAPEGLAARARLLSEALRPADTTASWANMGVERAEIARRGCDGLRLIEAADEREEALAVAVALREILAEPGRTAALVTPDRALAARVAAELGRWGISVEDSAGLPLSDTAAGRLARLAADTAAEAFRPVRILALLAHPDVRLGLSRREVERAAGVLEIGVLRGPAPGPGFEGLRLALAGVRGVSDYRTPRPRRRLSAADWSLAAELIERLAQAFGDFGRDPESEEALDLAALGEVHRATVEALRQGGPDADDQQDGSWEALAGLFDDLALAEPGVEGRFADYPAFFAALARQRTHNAPARAAHRRLTILGLLEARLLSVDRVVLGGLDEGVWPPRVETDAFLNRPMRAKIGLSPPERRIGQTAHDFVQALGTQDAIMTRAAKRDGKPMVPSRFVQRLKAFTGETIWQEVVRAGDHYRRLAHRLDEAPPEAIPKQPAPRPSPALFPRALSVTEIETLVRDPYSIFARHILKLDPLEALAEAPSAAARGTIIHEVLGKFAARYPEALPADPHAELIRLGEEAFGELKEAAPELFAEWWPRFKRLAAAFAVWETQRRGEIVRVYPEAPGSLEIPLSDGTSFRLRARADRIEERRDGSFVIVDFKTGEAPTNPTIYAGFSPQLTLEAAMLARGGFKDVPAAGGAPELLYVKTTGGRQPLKDRPVEPPTKGRSASIAVPEIVESHFDGLRQLVEDFTSGRATYLSRPFAQYLKAYAAYDHLARVKEWSAADEDAEEIP
jgi:ATP-dependent helicase/nuclease subunit B